MARGLFSYAHIDLLLSEKKECWLAEINLRGGLKGAQITGETYRKKIKTIHERLLLDLRQGTGQKKRETSL